jgi:O-acetyl-ADP-ribose deacetylase (regulator of RNase III)
VELQVVRGDITRLDVDAIVNAANNRMRGGGGVDGAIHHAAGGGLLAECVERFPDGLATGAAGWTTGHLLPARWVIHVVGPVHGRGRREQLVSCYTGALAVADQLIEQHGLSEFSMAFPLVSAGVYGWPLEDAVAAEVDTLVSTPTRVTTAVLVGFNDAAYRALLDAIERMTPEKSP